MKNDNILHFDGFSVQIVNFSNTTVKGVLAFFAEAIIIFSGRVFLVMPDVSVYYNGRRFWFDDRTSGNLKNFYFSKIKAKDVYCFIADLLYKLANEQYQTEERMEQIGYLLDLQFDPDIGGDLPDIDLSEFDDMSHSDSSELLIDHHDSSFSTGYGGTSVPRIDGNKPSAIQRAREHLASSDKGSESIGFLRRAMKYHEVDAS